MGESTWLFRSFSHPCDASREVKEECPVRVLTESISFGRYMSESLDWEKWSIFSHNRYLEEAEQFSKPGSVAQKRAYFEDHYRKRAAMKATAFMDQIDGPEAETESKTHDHSPMDATVNEQPRRKPKGEKEVEIEEIHQDAKTPLREKPLDDSASPHKVSSLRHSSEESAEKSNLGLSSRKKQTSSSSLSSSRKLASKPQKPSPRRLPSEQKNDDPVTDSNGKKFTGGHSTEKKKPNTKSVHMSIDFASCLGETIRSVKTSKNNSSSITRNQNKEPANGVSKILPFIVHQAEESRSRTQPKKQASGAILREKTSSISRDCSSSSNANGIKKLAPSSSTFAYSGTIANEKEAKLVLHKKEGSGLKKQQQDNKSKLREGAELGPRPQTNNIKKMPLTKPRSPKLGRKKTGGVAQETTKNNTTTSTRRPPSSLSKKKALENASPNIQD